MTDTQWGRKETIVRPPHYPVYIFGAVFVALVVTLLCTYLHLAFVMTPLQRYYLSCYAETGFLETGVPGVFCTSFNERNWNERSLEWHEERSIRQSRL
jgi:hypothetical protein